MSAARFDDWNRYVLRGSGMVDSESGEGQTLSTTEEREKKIESLVMQWGKDRGILENSTPFVAKDAGRIS
jgi:hypothetical protein